jgi:anti-sigma regulatory factor (Ser/Thr protein kinase)
MTMPTHIAESQPHQGWIKGAGTAVTVCRTSPVTVVHAGGPLGAVAGHAHRAALTALADTPTAVVCDLSAVTGPYEPSAVRLLAALGAHAEHWPGTAVGLLCPDGALQGAFHQEVLARHLHIEADRSRLRPLLSGGYASTTVRESMTLAPTALAARAARDMVARACLDWGRSSQISAGTLIVSELVTNALMHAGTDLEVSLIRCGPRIRVAVKDRCRRLPQPQEAAASATTGRGLVLVDALAESWGTLPTIEDGKVVWAVLLERAGVPAPAPATSGRLGQARGRPRWPRCDLSLGAPRRSAPQ